MSVVSYLKLTPKDELRAQFERDLAELTSLVRQQKGFIGVEVLRPSDDSMAYVILSEWENEADFKAWEHSPRHKEVMDAYLHRGQEYKRMRLNRYR